MINLRPHHLFCITLFSGHGYDEEFTKNMSEIISKLPKEHIKIVRKHDDLCNKCPNNRGNGICSNSKDNVQSRDNSAIKELQINEDLIYNYEDLKKKLLRINEIQFNNVCENCEWKTLGFCNYVIFKRNIKAIT